MTSNSKTDPSWKKMRNEDRNESNIMTRIRSLLISKTFVKTSVRAF